MEEVLTQFERWSGQGGWIMQVFLVIFGALLCDFNQRHLLSRLEKTLARTRNPWMTPC